MNKHNKTMLAIEVVKDASVLSDKNRIKSSSVVRSKVIMYLNKSRNDNNTKQ